jgi:hypothetical protein
MALIRPFVPARDFTQSRTFYEAIGFTVGFISDELVIFDQEGAGFLLQNFYDNAFAENLMLQLFVADVNTWWLRTEGLAERFGVRAPIAPADKPEWGLRVGFLFDPTGVLWQVSQSLSA